MREIKFRAWSTEAKEMRYDAGWAHSNTMLNDGIVWMQSLGLVLMQYTGLKDVNKKDVYEGDIVLHVDSYRNTKTKPSVVKWEYGAWDTNASNSVSDQEAGVTYETDIEVIGNIWEHPNLLKHDSE